MSSQGQGYCREAVTYIVAFLGWQLPGALVHMADITKQHLCTEERRAPAAAMPRYNVNLVFHVTYGIPSWFRTRFWLSTSREAPQRIPTPMSADSTDAENTAIFAAAKSASVGNAWPAMNSDMVNPIPANAPAPAS